MSSQNKVGLRGNKLISEMPKRQCKHAPCKSCPHKRTLREYCELFFNKPYWLETP